MTKSKNICICFSLAIMILASFALFSCGPALYDSEGNITLEGAREAAVKKLDEYLKENNSTDKYVVSGSTSGDALGEFTDDTHSFMIFFKCAETEDKLSVLVSGDGKTTSVYPVK